MWLFAMLTSLAAVFTWGHSKAFAAPMREPDPITGQLRAIQHSLTTLDTRMDVLSEHN